jgi:hypothetical protein
MKAGAAPVSPAAEMWARPLALLLLYVLAGGVLVWIGATLKGEPNGDVPTWLAVACGLFGVAIFLGFATIVTGKGHLLTLVMGDDGRLSVSKFQVTLWSAVVAYVYVMLWSAHAIATHDSLALSNLPSNVLIALGFSATTGIFARAITVSKISSGALPKAPMGGAPSTSPSALVMSDDSTPDINKIQMLFWTVIAIVVYLVQAHQALHAYAAFGTGGASASAALVFPNIDQVLMVLMGLSQATYLGNKITAANMPRLISVTPAGGILAKIATPIMVSGDDLGSSGTLLIDRTPYWGAGAPDWSDAKITFTLPPRRADGSAWTAGDVVALSAESGGQPETNAIRISL